MRFAQWVRVDLVWVGGWGGGVVCAPERLHGGFMHASRGLGYEINRDSDVGMNRDSDAGINRRRGRPGGTPTRPSARQPAGPGPGGSAASVRGWGAGGEGRGCSGRELSRVAVRPMPAGRLPWALMAAGGRRGRTASDKRERRRRLESVCPVSAGCDSDARRLGLGPAGGRLCGESGPEGGGGGSPRVSGAAGPLRRNKT